jgi:hypothetical protein
MAQLPPVVVLYTTAARPQYLRHILAAAASPRGSMLRNRYARRYVSPEVWTAWVAQRLRGHTALICYVESAESLHPFALPVRWGVIRSSHAYGEFGVLDVELEEHTGGAPLSEMLLGTGHTGLLVPGPTEGLLVVKGMSNPLAVRPSDEAIAWQDTVNQLTNVSSLQNASFIFLEGIHLANRNERVNLRNGLGELKIGRNYELLLFGLSPDGRPDGQNYRVEVDDRIINARETNNFDLGYRFDAIRIPIQPTDTRKTPTTIRISPAPGTLGPTAQIGVVVHGNRVRSAVGLVTPGIAAALAASAGVLPDTVPTWFKIAVVLSGSAGLAIASSRLNKQRR